MHQSLDLLSDIGMRQVIVQSPRPQLERMPGQTPELSIPKLDQRRIAWNMILSEAHTPSACSMASLTKVCTRQTGCSILAIANETTDYAS
jgi:hypothetical protein